MSTEMNDRNSIIKIGVKSHQEDPHQKFSNLIYNFESYIYLGPWDMASYILWLHIRTFEWTGSK